MEKPLYKVGDILIWRSDSYKQHYTIVKVREDSYDLYDGGKVYKEHPFLNTHGNVRKLTKLERALK